MNDAVVHLSVETLPFGGQLSEMEFLEWFVMDVLM